MAVNGGSGVIAEISSILEPPGVDPTLISVPVPDYSERANNNNRLIRVDPDTDNLWLYTRAAAPRSSDT